ARAAAVFESESDGTTDDILPTAARLVGEIVRETPWASVGVLLRKNEEVAEMMNLLRAMHVPASEEGGNPITDSAAVLVILSLLTLADHPGDTACRFHVATSRLGESLSFLDDADDAAAAELATRVRERLTQDGYGPALACWSRMLEPAGTLRDRMRLGQLVELGYRFAAEATLRPVDFVRFVEQERFFDPSTDHVQVMTVHKAKGLEFDVVVAPLTERFLRGQPPPFVAGRRGSAGPIDRVCLYRKEAIRKLLPAAMQDAFTAARSREIRETLCRLYVTATRAIHALHVLIPASSDREKSLPSSPAGLVRAALSDGGRIEPEQLLYEAGDRTWFLNTAEDVNQTAASGDRADRFTQTAPQTDFPVRLAGMPTGRSRGRERAAPSRHESQGPVRMHQVLRPQSRTALRRGTLIHAWFEQIAWLDEGRPPDDRLERIAFQQGFSAEETAELLGRFRSMLNRPQLAELLSRSGYTSPDLLPFPAPVNELLLREQVECDVRRELPIAARTQGAVTTGSIDRMVLLVRGPRVLAADIIDFKTDAVHPSNEPDWSERISHYREQLAAYATAVSQIHQLPRERIAARLAFVEPQVVVTLDLSELGPE
ncbi:MAG: 3'-5' exonuclease, partial [Planctomycetaceae bacterium]